MATQILTDYEINEIRNRVKLLGNFPMKEKSHGFQEYGGLKIIDAAQKQINAFENKEKNAAIAVMGVVLGANRNWERQVFPHIRRMEKEYKGLTFKQLQTKLLKMEHKEFKEVWGHTDEKKYKTLKALIEKILEYSKENTALDDLLLMRKWVGTFDLKNRKDASSPGSIPNVGLATFQHLRIVFGIDTVKPDQRVKEVLFKEFGKKFRTEGGKKFSDEKTILAVQDIARITGQQVIMIDQIFVKYGSGYYSAESKTECA